MKNSLLVVSLVLLLCFAFGCQNKAEKTELVKLKAQKTVEEQNQQIARDFFAAIDQQDFPKLKELLADDFTLADPGSPVPLNAENLFSGIKDHYTAFPDWRHVIEDVISEGDKVAVKLIQYGTHKAEYTGIPATGNQVHMAALHIGKIVDGKIKEWSAVEDYLGLMQQLGMELKLKEVKK